ncbi:MAG: hypothetical protein R6V52_03520 [Bacteroidales bacterium]
MENKSGRQLAVGTMPYSSWISEISSKSGSINGLGIAVFIIDNRGIANAPAL